jgi:hypothetical protein
VLQLERDALHIYGGVAAMLLTAAATRWRLDQWRVLVPLLVLALANEAADLLYDPWVGGQRARQWGEAVRDMINSLGVPVLLRLIVRRARR